jgi:cytosine/adenosine deaminase-related metal-dependent hydrolase
MLVIRNGRALNAARRALEDVDILVRDDVVIEVGPRGLAAPADATVVDAAGMLLIPGLVNAHTHGHGGLTRGLGDRWSLELLLNAAPWLNGGRTAEERYLSTLLGAIEMVQKGTTACYDLTLELPLPTPEGLEAVARAYAEVGMRAVVAPMMADRTLFEAIPALGRAVPAPQRAALERLRLPPWEETLRGAVAGLRGWKVDRAQVTPALAPTIPLHCSDPFLVACRDAAREHGVGLHMHVAESRVQAVTGHEVYGTSLTGHLARLGLLGPSFVAAHGVWLEDEDLARLADAGAAVAHNPGSNLRLGSGVARVRAMRERGVTVGIGTDAAVCSDNLNMFEAMRTASFVSRLEGPDPERWLSTVEVFEMATEVSARALGWGSSIGRLAPGYKADVVFLDAGHVNYVPLNDPVNQVVHVEDGTAVRRVMIGGRIVVDNGRVTTVDMARVRTMAEAAVERLRAAGAPARSLAEQLEPSLIGACQALAAKPYPVERTLAGRS